MSVASGDGPRATVELSFRGAPLASAEAQRALLDGVALPPAFADATFDGMVGGVATGRLRVLQVNLGKTCNMTCAHCHVDAGPHRREQMDDATVGHVIAAMDALRPSVVDLTGGAPELHPRFRELVVEARARGIEVIDRCNLTILLVPRFRALAGWLADHGVTIVASLPHYRARGTDAQRGDGTFSASIEALRLLNQVGYGDGRSDRQLHLMTNPSGAFLAPDQAATEVVWKRVLLDEYGVRFDRLLALNNMPIARFLEWLEGRGSTSAYLAHLVQRFNPGAAAGLMCRDTLSVRYDGATYACDFNQMLELPVEDQGCTVYISDVLAWVEGRAVRTGRHCFGCTAGAGSSCAGATG